MRRFVVPVSYLNQPLFQELLSHAEEKFGFDHPMAALTIPCKKDAFIDLISRLNALFTPAPPAPPRLLPLESLFFSGDKDCFRDNANLPGDWRFLISSANGVSQCNDPPYVGRYRTYLT
ncbi:hypothetical protein TIFTF001_032442 [Ficus carica]|uniref:Uncharacterized protein n=1 Tax=Ficus carica TaxID=3494 RepID=A0AA88DX74_FICCA|nr:hypothetical protein TIFTF001_032442 [Ficus carica]